MTRKLMQQALHALIYHTKQTRPIERTEATIMELRKALGQPSNKVIVPEIQAQHIFDTLYKVPATAEFIKFDWFVAGIAYAEEYVYREQNESNRANPITM